MNNQPDPPPFANLDPIARVIAFDWMRQAVEEHDPPGLCECWRCGQWRPDVPNDEKCPHCGAAYVAF